MLAVGFASLGSLKAVRVIQDTDLGLMLGL